MKEIRIPYSLPMARARRSGLKTQTRRVAKGINYVTSGGAPLDMQLDDIKPVLCPYGQPGDMLLPAEPWRAPVEFDAMPPRDIPAGTPIWLDAQGPATEAFGRYRHARFMPRHLVQARDELVAVRVERLQVISESDAIAEGIEKAYVDTMGRQRWTMYNHDDGVPGEDVVRYVGPPHTSKPIESYKSLWLNINGPGSWAANPWVWVVEFKVIVP